MPRNIVVSLMFVVVASLAFAFEVPVAPVTHGPTPTFMEKAASNGSGYFITYTASGQQMGRFFALDGSPVADAFSIAPVDDYATALASDGRDYLVGYIATTEPYYADDRIVFARVSSADGVVTRAPDLIADAQGLEIVWTGRHYLVSWKTTGGKFMAALLSSDGTLFAEPRQLWSGVNEEYAIAANRDGDVVVLWNTNEGMRVGHVREDAWAAGELPTRLIDRVRGRPDIGTNGQQFLAVWSYAGTAVQDSAINAVELSSDGSPRTSVHPLAFSNHADSLTTIVPSGSDYYVLYPLQRGSYSMAALRVTSDGSSEAPVPAGRARNVFPVAAATAGADTLVAWIGFDGDERPQLYADVLRDQTFLHAAEGGVPVAVGDIAQQAEDAMRCGDAWFAVWSEMSPDIRIGVTRIGSDGTTASEPLGTIYAYTVPHPLRMTCGESSALIAWTDPMYQLWLAEVPVNADKPVTRRLIATSVASWAPAVVWNGSEILVAYASHESTPLVYGTIVRQEGVQESRILFDTHVGTNVVDVAWNGSEYLFAFLRGYKFYTARVSPELTPISESYLFEGRISRSRLLILGDTYALVWTDAPFLKGFVTWQPLSRSGEPAGTPRTILTSDRFNALYAGVGAHSFFVSYGDDVVELSPAGDVLARIKPVRDGETLARYTGDDGGVFFTRQNEAQPLPRAFFRTMLKKRRTTR